MSPFSNVYESNLFNKCGQDSSRLLILLQQASLILDERRLTVGQWRWSLIIYFRLLLVPSAAVGTFSFHAPDLCCPRWPADGSHRHPSRHQCCGQALQNHGQDTKDYHSWTWWGRLSPDITDPKRQQFVERSRRSPIIFFWEDPAKCMTRIWVLTRLALGEPSLQLATSHSQTNPPSMKKVTFHTGAPGTGATMFPSRTVHWWGAFRGQVLRDFRCRSCFLLEFNIDLVTPVSLWRHCHLPSAQFQTTHFLVRLAVNRARRTLS